MFARLRKAPKDFNNKDLPKNRKEAFFDIMKLHYGLLFKLGLISFLFLLPLLFISINADLYYSKIYQEYLIESISEEEFNLMYKNIFIFSDLLKIPCFIIFGIGLAGIIKIFRRIIFYEPVFFKDDFFSGIKENILSLIVISLLFGLVNLSIDIFRINTNLHMIIRYLPFALSYVFIFPTFMVSISMIPIYKANVFSIIKDGLKLHLKSFLKTILFSLMFYVVTIISLINAIYGKYVILIIFIIFLLPIAILAFCLNMAAILDIYVNKEYHKEIYRLGVFD